MGSLKSCAIAGWALAVNAAAPVHGQTVLAVDPVYQERCAACHEGGVPRAPNREALKLLSADQIRASLLTGNMSAQGRELTPAQLDAVVRFLARAPASASVAAPRCAMPDDTFVDAFARPHWNGWGAGPAQTRFQNAAMAQLSAADVPRLKLKWAHGFADVTRAYAQPTVIGGRLFVGSATGKVVALDAATGCTHWEFSAATGVRSAISAGQSARGWTLYFGDERATVYAVDASSGQSLWSTKVDEHRLARVTGAPVLHEGVLYVPLASIEEFVATNPNYPCCTFRGGVTALDANSGKLLWQGRAIVAVPKPTRKNPQDTQLHGPSGAAVWSALTIDAQRGRVYATTGNSYSDPASDGGNAFVAFGLASGERAWVRQMTAGDAYTMACAGQAPGGGNCPEAGGPDVDFGSSGILVSLGGGRRALIAGQKSGVVHAIDPDRDGAVLWQTRLGAGGKLGGVQWGSAADDRHVYVALSDVRLRPANADTPGAQPFFAGGSLQLDPHAGGGLFALELATGKIAWQTPHPGCKGVHGCSPAQSAAVTAIAGVVFSGGVDGHLRAYAAATGQVIWDLDTRGAHPTVNGVAAQGGSLDGPGPVVAGGMLYVNSGYAIFGGMPGNVLLAYSVDGK